jgi:hypothetical protein
MRVGDAFGGCSGRAVEENSALAECRVLFVGARATSGQMQAQQTGTEHSSRAWRAS